MKKHMYFLWIAIFFLPFGGCSKQEDCDPDDEESPCYAGLSGGSKGVDECSYKITIDGQTTVPNRFGQDKLVIQTSGRTETGTFLFSLAQAKENSPGVAVFTFMAEGSIERGVPVHTTYAVAGFQTTSLISPSVSTFPLYGYAVGQEDYGKLIFTLLENSDQRIRMKVTGTVMKLDEVGNTATETGLVPVVAEISIGRKHYTDAPANGSLPGGAVCECQ